jgi:hypothetical protein
MYDIFQARRVGQMPYVYFRLSAPGQMSYVSYHLHQRLSISAD